MVYNTLTKQLYAYFDVIFSDDDDTVAVITAKIWYVSDFDGKVPENVSDSWDENTPAKRAEATVNANLEYLNSALTNSKLPIKYVVWGEIQDIGMTDAEIGQQNKSVVFNK